MGWLDAAAPKTGRAGPFCAPAQSGRRQRPGQPAGPASASSGVVRLARASTSAEHHQVMKEMVAHQSPHRAASCRACSSAGLAPQPRPSPVRPSRGASTWFSGSARRCTWIQRSPEQVTHPGCRPGVRPSCRPQFACRRRAVGTQTLQAVAVSSRSIELAFPSIRPYTQRFLTENCNPSTRANPGRRTAICAADVGDQAWQALAFRQARANCLVAAQHVHQQGCGRLAESLDHVGLAALSSLPFLDQASWQPGLHPARTKQFPTNGWIKRPGLPSQQRARGRLGQKACGSLQAVPPCDSRTVRNAASTRELGRESGRPVDSSSRIRRAGC